MTFTEELLREAMQTLPNVRPPALEGVLDAAGRRRTRRRLLATAAPLALVLAVLAGIGAARAPSRATLAPAGPLPTPAPVQTTAPVTVTDNEPAYALGLVDHHPVFYDVRAAAPLAGAGFGDTEVATAVAAGPASTFLAAFDSSAHKRGCSSVVRAVTLHGGRAAPGAPLPVIAGQVQAMAISRDGSKLALSVATTYEQGGCDRDVLQVRDAHTGTLLRSWRGAGTGGASFIVTIRWSPDGHTLALSSGQCCGYTTVPKLFDTAAAGSTYPVDGHLDTGVQGCTGVAAGDFDGAGDLIAVLSCDGGMQLGALNGTYRGPPVALPPGTYAAVSTDASGTYYLIDGQHLNDGGGLQRIAPPGDSLVW